MRFICNTLSVEGRRVGLPFRPVLTNEASLEQRGASAHHSIAVFLTTFFANFRERRQREVRRLDTLQATRLWGSGGATR